MRGQFTNQAIVSVSQFLSVSQREDLIIILLFN